jgi:hypothetical protein
MEMDSSAMKNWHVGPGKLCTHWSYGVSCDEYDQLRARSGNCCEVCRTPEPETVRGALVIDHYESGDVFFVRGLLCDRCNSVMARHDRRQVWGEKTRPWAGRAAEYHRNAWGATAEQLAAAADQIANRIPWTRRIGGYNPATDDLSP